MLEKIEVTDEYLNKARRAAGSMALACDSLVVAREISTIILNLVDEIERRTPLVNERDEARTVARQLALRLKNMGLLAEDWPEWVTK